MEDLFIYVLNVSIAASFLVLAVIVYRLLAKKAPKWVSVLLWGLVGARLLFPFEIESALSLIPSKNTVPVTIVQDKYPALDTGIGSIDEIVNPLLSDSLAANPGYSANPMQILIPALGMIWLAVMLGMLTFMAGSFVYLRIKTSVRVKRERGIYLCDCVKTPFILGVLRPQIYLPSDVSEKDFPLVIAHERAHIKRLDHLWKPLGFLLLSVYWFNPLLWVAYALLCRDIESACDEKVVSQLDGDEKADYSEALLNLGIKSRVISACPLAFGEVSVRSRISAISSYKRPTVTAIVASLAICAIIAACFLTYKQNDSVAIHTGIWYAGKVIGTADADATCDDVPRFVFTESGDVLVESKDLSRLSYVRLGRVNTAYVSMSDYETLFDGVDFRDGFDAQRIHDSVRLALRITPSASSNVTHEEVYLLRSENELYMGYADGGKISTLYELRFNESLHTYLYTLKYSTTDTSGVSLVLDSSNGTGQITFGDDINYTAPGIYKYENQRLIFTSTDYFELRLVFLDVGDALIYSKADSDVRGFENLLHDGIAISRYYQLYGASSCTEWFDINGDGKYELIAANLGNGGTLWYLVHGNGATLAQDTVPFTQYDDISLEERDGVLYLVCEYSGCDFNSYVYRVEFTNGKLAFTEVEK